MKKRLISLALATSLLLSGNALAIPQVTGGADMNSIEQQEIYEAEDAKIIGATVKTDLDDYSGNGYIDGMVKNSSVSFNVNVLSKGNYGVRLRYSNGSGSDKTINVYANGALVRTAKLTPTINWDTWDVHLDSIALNAGENTVTYKIENDNTAEQVKLDRIALSRIYEAEDAKLLSGITVMNDHAGYSGTGFVSGFRSEGHGVEFTVDAPADGEYSLVARYAAGQEVYSRTLTINVNGNKTKTGMASMRSWDIWTDYQTTVHLKKGANTISYIREPGNNGEINLDYITVKQCQWISVGKINGFSGNNTKQLTFEGENAKVQITSIAANMVKVWCESTGRFDRKYDSFAVVNEEVDPQKLAVKDKGKYYEFSAGNMTVRINKDPFTITYLDEKGNVLCENNEESLGWSTDGELKVSNKLGENEQFWGLGEKKTSFNRRGDELAMWSCDAYGADADASIPASWENGRWYMANPYFVSSKGYSILFDNSSRTVFDLGKNDPNNYSFGSLNPNPGGELIYYFTYGPSIKKITKTYTDLVGKSFFAPDWALGNMQCHWGYRQSDIERVAQTYRDKKIPLDMIMADIDWYEYLCSPTQWNKNNFPDPEGMLSKLNDINVRFGLINDPNITNRDNNADFAEGNSKGYFLKTHSGATKLINWPWGAASGLTDFFNPEAQQWWAGMLDTILGQGVQAFWLDMNEPSNYNTDWLFWNKDGKSYGNLSEMKNVYANKHNETLYNKMTEDGKRSFLLTRSGFIGTHRYSSPWTGDIKGSWKSMREQINMGTSLSLTGYNYWGFDIGGFFDGVSNDQYKRWVELATFTPVHRFHYMAGLEGKEPWTHDSEEVSRKYINLRYQLMPYMYSLIADNIIGIGIEEGLGEGGTGIPMVRPMVMEYPEDQNTWDMDSQFMSGQNFLVAPVYNDSTVKEIYLPKGNWYDYKDGRTVYAGNQYIDYNAPVDTLPILVKAGAIVPMQPVMQYVGEKPIDELTLDVYPQTENGDSHFVLYEDDGETEDYKSGEYTTTRYELNTSFKDNNETLTFKIGERKGNYTDIADRDYMMQFHNGALKNVTVKQDGTALEKFDSLEALNSADTGYYADNNTKTCYVKVPDEKVATSIVLAGEPVGDSVYEAENAKLQGNAKVNTAKQGYTGEGYVEQISVVGDGVEFTLDNIPQDGLYAIKARYANKSVDAKSLNLKSGSDSVKFEFPATNGNWDTAIAVINLNEGSNTVLLSYQQGNSGNIEIDNIKINTIPVTVPEIHTERLFVEEAEQLGNATIDSERGTPSGFGYANNLKAEGDGVKFLGVNVLSDGTYAINIKYGNSHPNSRTMLVYANDDKENAVKLSFQRLTNWDFWADAVVNLPLKAGKNTITIVNGSGDIGDINIESISYSVTPQTVTNIPIKNGGFESGKDGWTVTSLEGGSGHGVDGQDAFAGNNKFYFYSAKSKQRLSQTVIGLENGIYMVTAYAKLTVNQPNLARIELSGYDGDNVSYTELPFSGSYNKYECIAQVKDGKLDIAFYLDGADWCSVQFDDVNLWKIETVETTEKGILENAINELSNLNKSDYKQAGWDNFETAMKAAELVLSESDAAAGRIYGALRMINNAKSKLQTADDDVLIGDVNKDGNVTVTDIVALRKIIMSGEVPSEELLKIADIAEDGKLTVTDIVALRKIIMS